MSVSDKLLAAFSRLAPHGIVTTDQARPHTELLARRRPRSQQQRAVADHSRRPDTVTDGEFAANLTCVTDPLAQKLVMFVALPWWEQDLLTLAQQMAGVLRDQCTKKRWSEVVEPLPVAVATLHELQSAAACVTCGTEKLAYDKEHGKWVTCWSCGGLGYHEYGYRKRWPVVKALAAVPVTERDYRNDWMQPHSWLYQHCLGLLDNAWEELKTCL